MTKTHFEQFSDLNIEFFESAKISLLDPLAIDLASDVKWIKLNKKWNSLKKLIKKKNINKKDCILLPFKTLKKIVSS